jgi:hypothetical protein
MRRHDKKTHMNKANLLFEQRCNENKFSWNGEYANEDEIKEGDDGWPYDVGTDTDEDKESYTDPYAIKDGKIVGMPGDMEVVDEAGTPLKQPEPTDVEDSQWFSDTDAERMLDKIFN